MLNAPTIVGTAFLYLCLLFAIAYWGDKRADRGRSIIGNPYIYALSIAVYCTSWTFYGSVGRAASSGVGFLPIYIGPTLTFILGWYLIRKIIRISKVNRITSIADFIASRYGKSSNLGGLVTIIAVVGILPYISLQLKAISMSFSVLLGYPEIAMPAHSSSTPVQHDTALYVALFMAAFAILFGTRHIDASEHHEAWWPPSPSNRWSSSWPSSPSACSSPTASTTASATCSRTPHPPATSPGSSPWTPAPATAAGSR
jgi:Na+/proline symporter